MVETSAALSPPELEATNATPHLCGAAAFGRALAVPPASKSAWFSLHHCSAVVGQAATQVGVLVPKRHAKRAVTRNAIRRQIYAWFAQWLQLSQSQSAPLQGWFVVRLKHTVPKARFPSADSTPLRQEVRGQLNQLAARFRLPSPSATHLAVDPEPAPFAASAAGVLPKAGT